MKKAIIAAGEEAQAIVRKFVAVGWHEAVASSGTANTIAAVLQAVGWGEGTITAAGLHRLRTHLVKTGTVEGLPTVRTDRQAILPGGVAVMCAAFEAFGLEEMMVSEAALRQGVLYDLLGRVQHRDMRQSTVEQYMRRYQVDRDQAERVARLARQIYTSLADSPDEDELQLLDWAARLHEIGLSIARASYRKHSAYVIANADMPGFSKNEQARLARIVLAHCGKLPKPGLPAEDAERLLILSLRLAALFYRSRADLRLPLLHCRATERGFRIDLPKHWLAAHPLTAAALEAEAQAWQGQGVNLDIRETGNSERPNPVAVP